MRVSTQILRGLRLVLVAVLASMVAGCATVDVASLLNPKLEEHTLADAPGLAPKKIVLLDLSGVISSSEGGMLSQTSRVTPEQVSVVLRRAEKDPRVKALVLRIDSPGGEATASDLIHHEILAFRERTGMPVYAAIQGMGCSGGYYAACAADRIYVAPTGITGSIGVIARFPQLTGLADKVGYRETILKSGPMKDMGNPLTDMSPETRAVLQEMIDTMYGRFLDTVVAARPAYETAEALRPVADGRIYTAPQAQENGLVDEVAYLDEVIEAAKAAAGLRDAKVVAYLYGGSSDSNLYSRADRGGGAAMMQGALVNVDVNMDLARVFGGAHGGFYYLWLPATE